MPLLPDPSPRERIFRRLASVDDHLCEPPDLFEGRRARRFGEAAPHIVEKSDGTQVWVMEGVEYPNVGLNAVVGRPKEEWNFEPSRFDEMRKGAWDVHARIADMDVGGLDVSLCFPSLLAGFAGTKFSELEDRELGLACVRDWNDWMIEEWYGSYPSRFIPMQLAYFANPDVAAADIVANAERGFKALSLPEAPHNVGFPSIHTPYWDPILRACEETGTVIMLHTGTGGWGPHTISPESPIEQPTCLFPACSLLTTADWLWARIPLRYPKLKVALAEGGIGWIPLLLDRLEFMENHELGAIGSAWPSSDIKPSEAVSQHFWFCTISDPSTVGLHDRIGLDHIMLEVDYPHASTTWPDTHEFVNNQYQSLDDVTVEKIVSTNATELFGLVPTQAQPA
jgi:predicted TIM-barrel fold metal-dependent hydrolase